MFHSNQQEAQEATGYGKGKYMANPHLKGTKYKKKIKPGNIKGKPHLDRAKAKPIRKDVMPASPKKKSTGEKYYSNLKGYKGTAYGVNKGSKSYRQKLADKKRADVKDAARGGFKSVGDMEYKGAITRIGQRVRKRDKAELTKLKGRR